MNKKITFALAACFLLSLNAVAQTGPSSQSARETELLEVARDWVDAWNGKIDKDRMMGQYHPDMQYIWRGKPMDYNGFESMLVTYIIPYTNYTLTMTNTIVRIINEGGAVVFLNFSDRDTGEEGAATLTLTKSGERWKVLLAHESQVRPLPPNDFEERFNLISQKYQEDYMNARCEGIMPYLDEELVIFENGEHWPYEKVYQYCPRLPVKPVISTDRAYKILGDNLVYEFVSQMYQREGGSLFNETAARIWEYSEDRWKIVQMEVSRYRVSEGK